MSYGRMFILVSKTTLLSLLWLVLQMVSYMSVVLTEILCAVGHKSLMFSSSLKVTLEDDFENLKEEVDVIKNRND